MVVGISELSIVRLNLLDNKDYRPYCGNMISRHDKGGCFNPRTHRRKDGQFVCYNCHWVSSFPKEFIDEYKAKHNIP